MRDYSDLLSTKIVKEKIDEAMNKSQVSGKEHGFNICSIGEDITATEIVVGNKSSLTLVNRCPGVKIGSFHVHPDSIVIIPSPTDMRTLEQNKYEKFLCIGVNLNDLNGNRRIVKCFDDEDLVKFYDRMYGEKSYEK